MPNSDTQGPLAAGSYSFEAVYHSADGNFAGSTSDCEQFTVAAGTSSVATQVNLAGTTTAIVSPIPLGSSVHDTATITPSDGFTPTGTVTYTFFPNSACTAETGSPRGHGHLIRGGYGAQLQHRGAAGGGLLCVRGRLLW